MKITSDLSPGLIHAKGVLFVLIGLAGAAMIFIQVPNFRTALLLIITIWGFCRFYYYLFYVLDRYLGRDKRFSGVLDALRYLLTSKNRAATVSQTEPAANRPRRDEP